MNKKKINGALGLIMFAIAGILLIYVCGYSVAEGLKSEYQVNELRLTIKMWKEILGVFVFGALGLYFTQK